KSILTAIDKSPSDPVLFALCGLIQRDLGLPNKALASISHAAELDPSNAQYARMLTEFTRGAYAASPSTTE
ncbi:MAG: tetratricopeptide repeat protein, partial [Phycisphaerales bacterium]